VLRFQIRIKVPDPHQNPKPNPVPHQSDRLGALEAHYGAMKDDSEVHNGAMQGSVGDPDPHVLALGPPGF
jgi:hypothetical protein